MNFDLSGLQGRRVLLIPVVIVMLLIGSHGLQLASAHLPPPVPVTALPRTATVRYLGDVAVDEQAQRLLVIGGVSGSQAPLRYLAIVDARSGRLLREYTWRGAQVLTAVPIQGRLFVVHDAELGIVDEHTGATVRSTRLPDGRWTLAPGPPGALFALSDTAGRATGLIVDTWTGEIVETGAVLHQGRLVLTDRQTGRHYALQCGRADCSDLPTPGSARSGSSGPLLVSSASGNRLLHETDAVHDDNQFAAPSQNSDTVSLALPGRRVTYTVADSGAARVLPGHLAIRDIRSGRLLGTFNAAYPISTVIVAPQTDRIFVVENYLGGEGHLSVLDGHNARQLRIPVAWNAGFGFFSRASPVYIALDRPDNAVLVAAETTVHVLDAASGSPRHGIDVGDTIEGLFLPATPGIALVTIHQGGKPLILTIDVRDGVVRQNLQLTASGSRGFAGPYRWLLSAHTGKLFAFRDTSPAGTPVPISMAPVVPTGSAGPG
jgi:hypothetical protein